MSDLASLVQDAALLVKNVGGARGQNCPTVHTFQPARLCQIGKIAANGLQA